jgi:very-short-patch-repair endonuclease
LLTELDIKFTKHKPILNIEHKYQCDIFISPNIIIECDGDYYHKYPLGREIDKIRTNEMIDKGYKVLRLWEHEINGNLELCKKRILNLVDN